MKFQYWSLLIISLVQLSCSPSNKPTDSSTDDSPIAASETIASASNKNNIDKSFYLESKSSNTVIEFSFRNKIEQTPNKAPTVISNDWWRENSIYQIWVRSFYDSDNNGNGDIRGIIEKFDYIKSLNVKSILLMPYLRVSVLSWI